MSEYNRYMGGVDKGDQLRGYYVVRLKSMNYRYIFWFLFDVSVTNAYILSTYAPTTSVSKSQQNLKCFRLKLARQLIGTYQSRKHPGRPRRTSSERTITELQHAPSHAKSKRCTYCRDHRTPPHLHDHLAPGASKAVVVCPLPKL